MSRNKLSDAIDEIQDYIDNGDPIPVYAFNSVEDVLEAAWMYKDLCE